MDKVRIDAAYDIVVSPKLEAAVATPARKKIAHNLEGMSP